MLIKLFFVNGSCMKDLRVNYCIEEPGMGLWLKPFINYVTGEEPHWFCTKAPTTKFLEDIQVFLGNQAISLIKLTILLLFFL